MASSSSSAYCHANHAPEGGWDSCLLEPAPDDTICMICYDVMDDPHSACSNSHHACRECFEAHLNSPAGTKCPGGCGEAVRREGLTKCGRSVAAGVQISKLRACCKHARDVVQRAERISPPTDRNGRSSYCDWTGTFGELQNHLTSKCPLEFVECPYAQLGCPKPVRRRDLEAHLARATMEHMQLASSRIASLSSTVATLSSTVHTLQEQVCLTRLQMAGAAPQLLELECNTAMFEGRGVAAQADMPNETKSFLGLYKLDETKRVNGMPMWIHCEDSRRCIAFNREHHFWHAQRTSEAGEARGFLYRRSGEGSAPSPHATDSPWLAYTGNAFTGDHSWLEDGVQCVAWQPEGQPTTTTKTFATTVTLGGHLPPGMHTGARRCMGTFRRRDGPGAVAGGELVNGRHAYVKVDDSAMMMWFARWAHGATADQYTGWYVGNKTDLGHCRGYLMAPSKDVALRPSQLPKLWAVGRAGPGSGYEPAPGVICTVPNEAPSTSHGAADREVDEASEHPASGEGRGHPDRARRRTRSMAAAESDRGTRSSAGRPSKRRR
mmetsp:Transcript_10778/g.27706  ORF Transcript_10778/g.27706 Transcript_10778/m.27706 type:complete len:551 (+) Transcript_10778:90-1742(+)